MNKPAFYFVCNYFKLKFLILGENINKYYCSISSSLHMMSSAVTWTATCPPCVLLCRQWSSWSLHNSENWRHQLWTNHHQRQEENIKDWRYSCSSLSISRFTFTARNWGFMLQWVWRWKDFWDNKKWDHNKWFQNSPNLWCNL